MPENGVRGWLAKFVAERIVGLMIGGAVGLASLVTAGLWAYLREELPLSVIIILSAPAFGIVTLAAFGCIRIYVDLTSKRASLAIEYDPKQNLLDMGQNSSDIRLFVRNTSTKHDAKNLRVRIERLVAVGAPRAHPQAGQFNNVGMQLERFKQGDNLAAHENVEIKGPVTFPSNKDFFFRTDEPQATAGRYYCRPGTYRMTVFAIADNADPVRANFIVSEENGSLKMDWDRAA